MSDATVNLNKFLELSCGFCFFFYNFASEDYKTDTKI